MPEAVATLSQNDQVIDTTTSTTNGDIWFDNVVPGKYQISVIAPETKKGDFVVFVRPEEQTVTVHDGNQVKLSTPF